MVGVLYDVAPPSQYDQQGSLRLAMRKPKPLHILARLTDGN